MTLDLFHRLGDAASASVRRRVVALGLEERVNFRNVHFESHANALAEHGTSAVPALWDGRRLHVGEAACLAVLDTLV